MSSFKAVIFDLGGVVMGSPFEAIDEFEVKFSLPHNYINHCIKHFGSNSAFARFERNKITAPQFYTQFLQEWKEFGKVFSKEDTTQVHSVLDKMSSDDVKYLFHEMSQKALQMDKNYIHCLGILRGRGLKTAALTNNFIKDSEAERLKPFKSSFPFLEPMFDVIVESSKVGLRKPDHQIYRLVCQELKVAPEETIFLDDIGYNLRSASELGMQTIRVKLEKKLEALQELSTLLKFPHNVSLIPTSTPSEVFYDVGSKNLRLMCDVFGNFCDPLIFFLHGGGQTRHSWRNTAEILSSKNYCCITLDMKGHGDSYFDPEQKYWHQDYADDLDRLVEYVTLGSKLRRFIIVGV